MNIKKLALAMTVSLLAVSAFSCGNEESSESSEPSSVAETTTTTTEPATETTTETTATTEVTTEAVTEDVTETTTEAVVNAEIITNSQLLRMINDAFGMFTDKSFEGDVKTAQDWDIIDSDVTPDADAEITAEFLISSCMRATGFVNGESSMDEILECAVKYGVIADKDISAVDVSKATEIVEKAEYAWTHPDFETEIHVELMDGVIDLTNIIPADSIKYNGDEIELPSGYADSIKSGDVFILPKNSDGEGGAYKAGAVVELEDGVLQITGTPAEITDVYKSISSN